MPRIMAVEFRKALLLLTYITFTFTVLRLSFKNLKVN